jgi:hypothetical protein
MGVRQGVVSRRMPKTVANRKKKRCLTRLVDVDDTASVVDSVMFYCKGHRKGEGERRGWGERRRKGYVSL